MGSINSYMYHHFISTDTISSFPILITSFIQSVTHWWDRELPSVDSFPQGLSQPRPARLKLGPRNSPGLSTGARTHWLEPSLLLSGYTLAAIWNHQELERGIQANQVFPMRDAGISSTEPNSYSSRQSLKPIKQTHKVMLLPKHSAMISTSMWGEQKLASVSLANNFIYLS